MAFEAKLFEGKISWILDALVFSPPKKKTFFD
jgi:hypothetical protein